MSLNCEAILRIIMINIWLSFYADTYFFFIKKLLAMMPPTSSIGNNFALICDQKV